MLGLIGRKMGMSRLFTEEGVSIPVTVIQVEPNRIVQTKREAKEGYDAVQLTIGTAKRRETLKEREENGRSEVTRIRKRRTTQNRPTCGHFDAHGCEIGEVLREFRVSKEELERLKGIKSLTVDLFAPIPMVDVTGVSKGKGFAGVIKRWNFSSQPASHGNSLSHRAPGSIGQNQTPGRVFKGKKMAGHMGCERVTTKHLKVVRVDAERSLLLVKGAVPGATGGLVLIKPSVMVSTSILVEA